MTPAAFAPHNRLAHIVRGLDRIRFAQCVGRAQEAVDRIAPALAAGLDEDIRALATQCRQDEATVFEHAREIGLRALRIVETARLAGRPALADPAEGIWEMIDALTNRGVWHSDALRLHADGLAALSRLSDANETVVATLSELRRLRRAIGASAA